MSFYKLVINNVLRSVRTYGSYFLSATFSVFVFFTFAMLKFHPQLKDGVAGSSQQIMDLAGLGLVAAQVLVVLLSVIFLWYSFGTFMKARKRDLGIYLMLGMRPADLRKTLFGENMLIGVGAIISGVGFGLIFTKAILIVIQRLLHLSSGLDFYLPTMGILMTIVVFLFLFLLVSTVMILRIQTENLNQLGKSDETPQPLPKTHPFLVLLSFLLLALGYWALVGFANVDPFWTSIKGLLICVLATVAATFLFFNQTVVYYYKWRQKRQNYLKGTTLLSVSEGIYRAKENANMFALLACTAAVALVGISVTVALGSFETGSRHSASAAYVLSADATDGNDNPVIRQIGEDITEKITTAGYDPVSYYVTDWPMEFQTAGGPTAFAYVMKASDYNRIAKGLQLAPLDPGPTEIFEPASTANQLTLFEETPESQRTSEITVSLAAGEKGKFNLTAVPIRFRIANMYRFFIAADEVVTRFYTEAALPPMVFQIIDFKEWQTADQVNQEILQDLNERLAAFHEKIQQNEEETEASPISFDDYFNLSSKYQDWQAQRQANGLILVIGVLLGGTFFIFAASILYFRLFGDLDKAGQYHRSLYQIGLTPAARHRIVIQQMIGMYFLPMVIAMIHGGVAYWGIVQIAKMALWHYYLMIIGCYLMLFIILFAFSCWRYLLHLDLRAENPQK